MGKLNYWNWYKLKVQTDTKIFVPGMLIIMVIILVASLNGKGEAWLGIGFTILCFIWWLRLVITELVIDRIKYLKEI